MVIMPSALADELLEKALKSLRRSSASYEEVLTAVIDQAFTLGYMAGQDMAISVEKEHTPQQQSLGF